MMAAVARDEDDEYDLDDDDCLDDPDELGDLAKQHQLLAAVA